MADWRTERRRASFRGVEFEAEQLGVTGGRRIVVDDYPESEEHTTDDLGRSAAGYRLRGFLLGTDYLERRDALVTALEKKGEGELVHPWRGRLQVRLRTFSTDESVDQGGVLVVEMEFVEAGAPAHPVVERDAPAEAQSAADHAGDTSVLVMAAAGLTGLAGYMQIAVRSAVSTVYLVHTGAAIADAVAALLGDIQQAAEDDAEFAPTLFRPALALVDDTRALLALLTGYPLGTPRYSLGPELTAEDTAGAACLATLYQGIRVLILERLSTLAVEADYLSADAADESMTLITDALADEIGEVTDPGLLDALIDLRAALVGSLTDLIDRLPRLVTIDVPDPVPAILLAFDQHADTGLTLEQLEEREVEILSLNAIGHPGFVVGLVSVLARTEAG
jgi:prophage DNA circulation protein